MLRALARMMFSSRLPSASTLFGYSSISTHENPSIARSGPRTSSEIEYVKASSSLTIISNCAVRSRTRCSSSLFSRWISSVLECTSRNASCASLYNRALSIPRAAERASSSAKFRSSWVYRRAGFSDARVKAPSVRPRAIRGTTIAEARPSSCKILRCSASCASAKSIESGMSV